MKAFDRFIDAELIAKLIRPYVSEQNLDEPVLAHVLGAWWERAPLRPDAVVPRRHHPFSQVNKKLLDP